VLSRNATVVVSTLLLAAAILSWQLLIPPIVGLANNGDFDRVMGWAGLDYVSDSGKDNFVSWMLPEFRIVPFAWRPSSYLSSETPVAAVAVLAARVFSRGAIFDVRVLGGLHILLLLIAIGTIVGACRDLSPASQWVVGGLLVFFFTDVGYAAVLNSLYSQTASFLFLMLTAATAAVAIRRDRLDGWLLFAYFTCAALFVCAKPQESLQGPLLAVFGLRLAGVRSERWTRQPALWLALGLCLVCLAYYARTPDWLRPQTLYNSLFRELLANSPDPARDLAELGLDPGLVKYINGDPYRPESPLHDPVFTAKFTRDFNYGALLGFYLSHPRRFASLLGRGAHSAFHLRALVLGNFPKARGLPPRTMTTRFGWWSSLRLKLTGGAALWLGVLFLGNLALAGIGYRRAAHRGRLFREGVALLVLMSGVEFLVCVLGEELGDLARHLFVFHALCDLLIVLDVAWLTERFARRPVSRPL